MTSFIFLMGNPDPKFYSSHEANQSQSQNNIRMDDVIRLAEDDPFWAHRGKAIQGYAQMEQSLSYLLADVSGMPIKSASTVFYKLTNTGSRTSILERLLVQKYGNIFNLFWNAFFKNLRIIDTKRSEIAHWVAATNSILDSDNILHVGVSLIHPDYQGKGHPKEQILSADLIQFQIKCETFSRLTNMFIIANNPPDQVQKSNFDAWIDIFQQPLIYPLPEDHLLFRNSSTPENPPQSSQV